MMRILMCNWSAIAVACLGLLAPTIRAQQNGLGPGDVALIAWDENGGTSSLFSFVALEPIPVGTRLYFTNNGWNNGYNGHGWVDPPTFRTPGGDANGYEELLLFMVNTPIPAGTIVSTFDAGFGTWDASSPIPPAGSQTYSSLSLSPTGDQINVFEAFTQYDPLASSALLFLFVLDDTGAFENATTDNTGHVLPGLAVSSHTAVTFAQNGPGQGCMVFDTSVLAHGTKLEWLAAIADPANWGFADSGQQPFPTGTIVVDALDLDFIPFCLPGQDGVPPCPCNNPGTPGRGCDNGQPTGTGGAELTASGSPSLSADTLSLDVTHTLNQIHVLWECTAQRRTILRSGAGVHCLWNSYNGSQGFQLRILKATASGGAVSFTGVSAASAIKGRPLVAGQSYFYSAVYRNSAMMTAPGCNITSGFNWTNAGSLTWRP
jgi:hypothetical protein